MRRSALCIALMLLVPVSAWAAPDAHARKRAFTLVEGKQPRSAIIVGMDAGTIEKTAVDLLVESIRKEGGAALPVLKEFPAAGTNVLIVGTLQSNPHLARLQNQLKPEIGGLGDEGFLLRTLKVGDRDALCIVGHDERGVLFGVQEAISQLITSSPEGAVYATQGSILRRPAVPMRGTYSLTCWGLAPRYDRQAWEKTIDSMSAAGMNRIMFWMDGLFRSRKYPYTFLNSSYFTGAQLTDDDIHQLIRRAHDRGMEFELGSGVFGWFTSGTFAEKFKEAADHSGSNLCPSHPLAQKLTLDYLAEMHDVFPEADGFMLEIRDEIGDCKCEKCQKPLDKRGSRQFGQSELDLLEKLTSTVWPKHPKAKFVWLMGYDNHAHDPMYYDRLQKMGRDPRIEWLEVRGSWNLPTTDGKDRPLATFSDRASIWGGGYYAISADGMQQLVQRITREKLRGYLPAYEPGFGTASIYSTTVPYPVDLVPFNITQFYYRAFTWEPDIDKAGLLARARRHFFSDEVPAQLSVDLLSLRDFMQSHYPELTCVAPGLIRTNTLAEGVDQIWNDVQMPDKKAKLTELAGRVRSLQSLARGEGDMGRLIEVEERIKSLRTTASPRSAATFALMQTAIDDIRKTLDSRRDDVARADDTLARIQQRIQEYSSRSATKAAPG